MNTPSRRHDEWHDELSGYNLQKGTLPKVIEEFEGTISLALLRLKLFFSSKNLELWIFCCNFAAVNENRSSILLSL